MECAAAATQEIEKERECRKIAFSSRKLSSLPRKLEGSHSRAAPVRLAGPRAHPRMHAALVRTALPKVTSRTGCMRRSRVSHRPSAMTSEKPTRASSSLSTSPRITQPAWPSADGRTLVFIHGWPDTIDLWTPIIGKLTEQGHKCVSVALPGYPHGSVDFKNKNTPDFDDAVRDCVDAIQISTVDSIADVKTPRKVTLVCHDWGCVVGFKVQKQYPELIEGLVALDVGGDASGLSKKEQTFIVAYQTWLIAAHFIGGPIGDFMTTKFAKVAGAPVTVEGMGDTRAMSKQSKSTLVSSKLNWPYVAFWRDLLFAKKKTEKDDTKSTEDSDSSRKHTKVPTPTCPTLFLFGGSKPAMFHSRKWIEALLEKKEINGSDVFEIQNAGHWFVVENMQETFSVIQKWLVETSPGRIKIRSAL